MAAKPDSQALYRIRGERTVYTSSTSRHRRNFPVQKRILLAIDDSKAAHRALQYVGEIAGGRNGFHVDLYHRLSALPPELREHGGSEFPDRETELGRQLSQHIAQWVASLKAELEPTLDMRKQELVDWGLAPGAIRFCIDEEVYPGETLADALK